MRYYHGGPPNLEEILPPAASGVVRLWEELRETDPSWSIPAHEAQHERESHWACIGERQLALRHAALWAADPRHSDGCLYEVAPPAGSLVLPDPASPSGEAWLCERATVLRVDVDRVTVRMVAALGLDPPGPVNTSWAAVTRYYSVFARARAEGRHVTAAEHAALEAACEAELFSLAPLRLLGL
jgi:hypothetical protein